MAELPMVPRSLAAQNCIPNQFGLPPFGKPIQPIVPHNGDYNLATELPFPGRCPLFWLDQPRFAIAHCGEVLFAGYGRSLNASAPFWDSKKNFDIPHPTKENHRLRYVCLEGPDADVYIKGKLVEGNVINLPAYWPKLVDLDSINITLTPIGVYQELFVERIEWGTRVIVKNNSGGPINCYYQIMAERIDVEKNIPEYEGLTPMDYPGDNNGSVINDVLRFNGENT